MNGSDVHADTLTSVRDVYFTKALKFTLKSNDNFLRYKAGKESEKIKNKRKIKRKPEKKRWSSVGNGKMAIFQKILKCAICKLYMKCLKILKS